MQSKLKETLVINMIIIVMLFIIGGYSLREGASVTAFAPIYKMETEEKEVYLMINVYEGKEYVEEYLKLFEKENVKATFFIGGCWAAKNQDTVKKIYNSGHEIGNHGYNHKLHTKLTRQQSREEIKRTNTLIRDIIGKAPTLFAPPSGDVNDLVSGDAEYFKMKTVMWTVDTIDWRDHDKEKIYKRVERNIQPGALVLMHPTASTLEALPDIILLLKSKGYVFKSI